MISRSAVTSWVTPQSSVAALAVAVVVGIVLALRYQADGGSGGESAPPPIAAVPTAAAQPWPAEQTVEATYTGDGTGTVAFTVQRWWLTPDDAGTATASVQVKVTNRTNTSISVHPELFVLLVDQVRQPDSRVGRLGADDSPDPGQATEHLVVFSRVPSGRTLELLCGWDADRRPVVLQGG